MGMTWDEFKKKIDELLADADKDGSVRVWYIDVTYPTERNLDQLSFDVAGEMSISTNF